MLASIIFIIGSVGSKTIILFQRSKIAKSIAKPYG